MSDTLMILLRSGGIKIHNFRKTMEEEYIYKAHSYLRWPNGVMPDVDNTKNRYIFYEEGNPFPLVFFVSKEEFNSHLSDVGKLLAPFFEGKDVTPEEREKRKAQFSTLVGTMKKDFETTYSKTIDFEKKMIALSGISLSQFVTKVLHLIEERAWFSFLQIIAGVGIGFIIRQLLLQA